ncbi:MAG: hypothetical protein GY714_08595 [Desulfobacterales bacterium]|nr:hypothetical protein [Desulfobacterales bacterium]
MNFPEVEQKVNRLVHNISEQNRSYYDVFLNQTPKTVGLKHYDEDGVLKDVTIPNIAKVTNDIGYIKTSMTLNVGPNRQYKSIAQAWNYLTNKRIEARVEIKVDDGVYETSTIWLCDHPNAEHIDIIGNISEPEKCILKFVPDSNGYSHGIRIINVKRLVFSGFKIVGSKSETTGHGELSTHRGIRIENHSSVYSHSNSIIIDSCGNGVETTKHSFYEAHKIRINNCMIGVYVSVLSFAFIGRGVINGLGKGTGTAVLGQTNSQIHCSLSTVNGFSRGVTASYNSDVICDGTIADNCSVGFTSFNSVMRNDRVRDTYGLPVSLHSTAPYVNGYAKNCDIGFESNYGGTMFASYAKAEKCNRGFYANRNSLLQVGESSSIGCSEWGYLAYGMAEIEAYGTQKNLSGNGNDYSMEHGVLGNDNAMIRRT